MNKIDEIALRVAEEQTRKAGEDPTNMWDEETKEFIIGYAHALLAELSKDAAPVIASEQKPVYFQWRRKQHAWSTSYIYNHEVKATTEDSEVRELYTSPPNAADIEQRVAEACAKMVRDAMFRIGQSSPYRKMIAETLEAIRSGKWREYL